MIKRIELNRPVGRHLLIAVAWLALGMWVTLESTSLVMNAANAAGAGGGGVAGGGAARGGVGTAGSSIGAGATGSALGSTGTRGVGTAGNAIGAGATGSGSGSIGSAVGGTGAVGTTGAGTAGTAGIGNVGGVVGRMGSVGGTVGQLGNVGGVVGGMGNVGSAVGGLGSVGNAAAGATGTAGTGTAAGALGTAGGVGTTGGISAGTTGVGSSLGTGTTGGIGTGTTTSAVTAGAGQSGLGARSAPAVTQQSLSAPSGIATGMGLITAAGTDVSGTSGVVPSTGILGATSLSAGGGGTAVTPTTPGANASSMTATPPTGIANNIGSGITANTVPGSVTGGTSSATGASGAAGTNTTAAGGGSTGPSGGTTAAGTNTATGTAIGGTGGGTVNAAGMAGTTAAGNVSGLTITNVMPSTLAAQVGFQPGDRILSVNNQAVSSLADLNQLLITNSRTNQPVAVRVQRNGRDEMLQLPSQQLSQLVATQEATLPDGTPGGAAMGIFLNPNAGQQIVVGRVEPGSPAALAGLQPGDRILSIFSQPLISPEQVRRAVALAGVGDNLRLTYERGGRQYDAVVPLASYASIFGSTANQGLVAQRTSGPALGVRVAQGTNGGVIVTAVPANSPAALAGIRPGDQIISIGGTAVNTPAALAATIEEAREGADIPIVYSRNGQEFRVTSRVGDYRQLFGSNGPTIAAGHPSIGVRLHDNAQGGPVVTLVAPGSPAAQAGVRQGDNIVAINGQPVRTPQDVVEQLSRVGIGNTVQIQYARGGRTEQGTVAVADHAAIYGEPSGAERQAARQPLEPVQNQSMTAPQLPPPPGGSSGVGQVPTSSNQNVPAQQSNPVTATRANPGSTQR